MGVLWSKQKYNSRGQRLGISHIKYKQIPTCEEGPHDTDSQSGHTDGLGQSVLGTQVRQQLDRKNLSGHRD